MPRRLADDLGLDWDALQPLRVSGVGQGVGPSEAWHIVDQTGGIELTVRCLFLDQRDAPYILGCADVLDRFALTIDTGQGKIVFTEIG